MRSILIMVTFLLSFCTHIPAFAEGESVVIPVVEVAAPIAKAIIAAPEEVTDLAGFIPALIEAVQSSNWLMLGALIALIGTFIVKRFVLPMVKLGSGVLPIVSALIGMTGGVGLAVVNGASPMAASMAILSGPLAGFLWDGIIKYFVKK